MKHEDKGYSFEQAQADFDSTAYSNDITTQSSGDIAPPAKQKTSAIITFVISMVFLAVSAAALVAYIMMFYATVDAMIQAGNPGNTAGESLGAGLGMAVCLILSLIFGIVSSIASILTAVFSIVSRSKAIGKLKIAATVVMALSIFFIVAVVVSFTILLLIV